jgi:hypothetical protein
LKYFSHNGDVASRFAKTIAEEERFAATSHFHIDLRGKISYAQQRKKVSHATVMPSMLHYLFAAV